MRPGLPPPWLPWGSLHLRPRAPVSGSVPVPVLSGAGGGRWGHAPLWVPPWGLAWGLGHVGPAGRSLQALSWASAARGAPGRLPLLSLGVSSWEGSWGRGGRVFLVLRGRWRPGSGGSSASCVWVVVSSPLSLGLHGGGAHRPRPLAAGPVFAVRAASDSLGCSVPGPGPAWVSAPAVPSAGRGRGPALPSDWGTPCFCACVALCSPGWPSPWGLRGHPELSSLFLSRAPPAWRWP